MSGLDSFPHKALTPFEASPRITPCQAEELLGLCGQLRELGMGAQKVAPAIVVACWCGGVVKYIVNSAEAGDTIANMQRAIAEAAAEPAATPAEAPA